MSKLEWKLLTKKRGSSTQGIPPGKEDLAWVTNTVTLIFGQRDAFGNVAVGQLPKRGDCRADYQIATFHRASPPRTEP